MRVDWWQDMDDVLLYAAGGSDDEGAPTPWGTRGCRTDSDVGSRDPISHAGEWWQASQRPSWTVQSIHVGPAPLRFLEISTVKDLLECAGDFYFMNLRQYRGATTMTILHVLAFVSAQARSLL